MSNTTPRPILTDCNSAPRRRSPRLSAPVVNPTPPVAVKRSITVRKIVPRKTQVLSEDNKENSQRLSGGNGQKKQKISTPRPVHVLPPKATMPSPVLAPSPILALSPVLASSLPQSHTSSDPQGSVWSEKVRRSYSRLSPGEHSFTSPQAHAASSPARQGRESFFGFENMPTPKVCQKVEQSRIVPDISESLCELTVVKEKQRRKRVPQLNLAELDDLASKMNAEFEEAEAFELVME